MTSRLPLAVLLAISALFLCRCASVGGARDAGVLRDGVFTPGEPAAASFGPNEARLCPREGPMGALVEEVGRHAGEGPKPVPDGRLCALAETLIDWDEKTPVPVDVGAFLAGYFGLPSSPRLTVAVTDTDQSTDLGERLYEPVVEFARSAVQPRYGLATQRINPKAAARGEGARASTKLVLALWDAPFTLDPLPRKLAPGQAVIFSGTLLGDAVNPQIDVGNVDGKLESPKQAPGKAFKADVRCGDRPGDIHVELRAEVRGAQRLLTNLTLACGVEPPASVAVAEPVSGAFDAAAEEKKLFDIVNAERVGLGLKALKYDDGIAKVARIVAETTRDDLARGGSGGSVDVVKLLKDNDIVSPVIIVNPARALSPTSAYNLLKSDPAARSRYLSAEATHAGFGLAEAKDENGLSSVILDEVFVKEQPPHDLPKLKEELRAGVLRRRADARAEPLEEDAELETAAQTYATELAAARNNLPKQRDEAILGPLRKRMASLHIISGAPREPTDFPEEPGVITPGKLMGLGVAEGVHPVYGKGTVYVVLLIGKAKPKGKGR